MRITAVVSFVTIIVLLAGCAGQITELSKDVESERKEIKRKVETIYAKYETGKVVYQELREAVRENWDNVPAELKDDIKEADQKLVEFDKRIHELLTDLKKANQKVSELEKKAKKADKKWQDIITTIKNITAVIAAYSA